MRLPDAGQFEARMPSRVNGAFDFADDVARAAENHVHFAFRAIPAFRRSRRATKDAKNFRGGSHCARRWAYSPPLNSCFTFVLMMSSARTGRSSARVRSCASGSRAGAGGLRAHHGNELVHDAARDARKFVLGFLAEQRLLDGINFFAGRGFKQSRGADFQARRCCSIRRRAARWNATATSSAGIFTPRFWNPAMTPRM
jgi:hypothetical protein